jgi:hypothetical protein
LTNYSSKGDTEKVGRECHNLLHKWDPDSSDSIVTSLWAWPENRGSISYRIGYSLFSSSYTLHLVPAEGPLWRVRRVLSPEVRRSECAANNSPSFSDEVWDRLKMHKKNKCSANILRLHKVCEFYSRVFIFCQRSTHWLQNAEFVQSSNTITLLLRGPENL